MAGAEKVSEIDRAIEIDREKIEKERADALRAHEIMMAAQQAQAAQSMQNVFPSLGAGLQNMFPQSQIGSMMQQGAWNGSVSSGGSIYGGPTGIGGGAYPNPPPPTSPVSVPGKRPPGAAIGTWTEAASLSVDEYGETIVHIKKSAAGLRIIVPNGARYFLVDGELQREHEKELSAAEQVKQSFDRHMALKKEREKNGKAK